MRAQNKAPAFVAVGHRPEPQPGSFPSIGRCPHWHTMRHIMASPSRWPWRPAGGGPAVDGEQSGVYPPADDGWARPRAVPAAGGGCPPVRLRVSPGFGSRCLQAMVRGRGPGSALARSDRGCCCVRKHGGRLGPAREMRGMVARSAWRLQSGIALPPVPRAPETRALCSSVVVSRASEKIRFLCGARPGRRARRRPGRVGRTFCRTQGRRRLTCVAGAVH